MSVDVGAERGRRAAGHSNDVHAVRNGERYVRVIPRRRPLRVVRHWLVVKHYASTVRRLYDDRHNVVEINAIL